MEKIWLKVAMFAFVNLKSWYHFLSSSCLLWSFGLLVFFPILYIYFFLVVFLTFPSLLFYSSGDLLSFPFHFLGSSSPRLKVDHFHVRGSATFYLSLASSSGRTTRSYYFSPDTWTLLWNVLRFSPHVLPTSQNTCISSPLLIHKCGKHHRLSWQSLFSMNKVIKQHCPNFKNPENRIL